MRPLMPGRRRRGRGQLAIELPAVGQARQVVQHGQPAGVTLGLDAARHLAALHDEEVGAHAEQPEAQEHG